VNVDLASDPGCTENNVSGMRFLLSWSTVDYTNATFTVAAGGSPVLIDADLVDAGSRVTKNPDGSYTVSSPVDHRVDADAVLPGGSEVRQLPAWEP